MKKIERCLDNVAVLDNPLTFPSKPDTFEQLAESAKGIKRIAVLRADVDNLGQAIVSGFDGKVSGLSRKFIFEDV